MAETVAEALKIARANFILEKPVKLKSYLDSLKRSA
jgi:hypothetical protein